MILYFAVCLGRITLDLSTRCCLIFYWIQYWNHSVWFTRSRCLIKICWFLVWYPFRYICYSSDSHRCWWCQLRKQCQSGVQHPPGTAIFLSGSRNRLAVHSVLLFAMTETRCRDQDTFHLHLNIGTAWHKADTVFLNGNWNHNKSMSFFVKKYYCRRRAALLGTNKTSGRRLLTVKVHSSERV